MSVSASYPWSKMGARSLVVGDGLVVVGLALELDAGKLTIGLLGIKLDELREVKLEEYVVVGGIEPHRAGLVVKVLDELRERRGRHRHLGAEALVPAVDREPDHVHGRKAITRPGRFATARIR